MKQRVVSKRELREFDISIPESLGDADYQTLIGKEYLLLSGTMYPNNETEFHAGRASLRKVANPVLELIDPYANTGYILYKWSENVPKQLEVKVIYVDVPENTRQGIIQPFRLVCKVRYPVIYAQQPKSATISITGAAQGGGAQIPAQVPMKIGAVSTNNGATLPFTLPVILGSQAGSSSGTLTNAGDFPTFPVIQIFGPISKPRFTNLTTGEYIELQLTLATGAAAVITYDQSTASITANGANAYNFLTTGSNLFKVYPGTSTFTLSGSSVGTGAYATVSFSDAWPLS